MFIELYSDLSAKEMINIAMSKTEMLIDAIRDANCEKIPQRTQAGCLIMLNEIQRLLALSNECLDFET